jgi:hypothetical protein
MFRGASMIIELGLQKISIICGDYVIQKNISRPAMPAIREMIDIFAGPF